MIRTPPSSVVVVLSVLPFAHIPAAGQEALHPPKKPQCETTSHVANEPAPVDAPVIVIRTDPGMQVRTPASLSLVVWHDGRVFFSRERDGEIEHRAGQVSEEDVTRCLLQLRQAGVFEIPYENSSHYGSDAEFVVLYARDATDEIELASWHERFEGDDQLVVNSRGVHVRYGRTRESFLDPPDSPYARFRGIWDVTKREMLSLIPEESEPFVGDWEALYECVGEVSFELQKKRYFERLKKKTESK
jgi:hypothetical protein